MSEKLKELDKVSSPPITINPSRSSFLKFSLAFFTPPGTFSRLTLDDLSIVPPIRGSILILDNSTYRPSISPDHPCKKPINSVPFFKEACRAEAITAFNGGTSPPPVSMPIFLLLITHHFSLITFCYLTLSHFISEAFSRLALIFFSKFPPPTERTKMPSFFLNWLPFNQSMKTDCQPLSFVRAV